MSIVWDEAAIRREFEKLDKKTKLKGAALPIRFGNARCTLGLYDSSNGGSFRFSNYYFTDPDWPEEEALDVIRHEYAHYMDHMLYGNHGHGPSWKQCCLEVGALPIRCYNDERAKYHKDRREKEERTASALDVYSVGSVIRHPKFGVGTITELVGTGANRSAIVAFKDAGSKKLSLMWIDKNCSRCA